MRRQIYKAFSLDDDDFKDCLGEVDVATENYRALEPLSDTDSDALAEYDRSFLIEYTFESNGIEGSTLTIGDTELVLEGEFVPNKSAREQYMAKGVADSLDFTHYALESNLPLSEDLIKDIHEKIALDMPARNRGIYRMHPARITYSDITVTDPLEIRGYMADLIYAYEVSSAHPIIKIAAFHAYYENIHPFADGNGRSGRAVMNYMLMSSGYPPISPKARGRKEYFDAMDDWRLRNNPDTFISFVADAVVSELKNRQAVIEATRLTEISLGDEGTRR